MLNLSMNIRQSIAAAFVLSFACAASAQQPQNAQRAEQMKARMAELFKQADANRDGRLTKQEANGKMPRLYANFDAIDTDRDGYVTPQNIAAFAKAAAAQGR
jgi:Ca2+-binding EF-hand superfamily protein